MYNNLINLDDTSITDDLQLKDKERLKRRSNQIAQRYDDYEINIGNYKEGKDDKQILNKAIREANRLRLNAVKSSKQREKDLKKDFDDVLRPLQNASDNLNEQIHDVDDALQDKRREKVSQVVHEMCSSRNMEDIAINPKWTEKSMCTRGGYPTKQCYELIHQQIKVAEATQKRIQMGSETIKAKADELDLDYDGYLNDFKKNPDHDNLKSIIKEMMLKAQKRQEDIENQINSKDHNILVDDKVVDINTGEVKGKWYYKSVTMSGVESDVDKLKKYAKQLGIKWNEEDK